MKRLNSQEAIRTLKIAADDTRFHILSLLLCHKKDQELCVSEIAEEINMTHSATSHQLAKLEAAGVLSSKRQGQNVCYAMKDTPMAKRLCKIIKEFE